tara:strand:+ start:23043 stop:23402 length:360 start_codon:yes stop_codon:yes gene_type:complete
MTPEVFQTLVMQRNTRGTPRALEAARLYLLGHTRSVRQAACIVEVTPSAANKMVKELESEYKRWLSRHGLAEVTVLVPEEHAEDAKHFAARLRKSAKVPAEQEEASEARSLVVNQHLPT